MGRKGLIPIQIYILAVYTVQSTERKTKSRKPEKTNLTPKQKNQRTNTNTKTNCNTNKNTCKHLKQSKRYFLLYIVSNSISHTNKQTCQILLFLSFLFLYIYLLPISVSSLPPSPTLTFFHFGLLISLGRPSLCFIHFNLNWVLVKQCKGVKFNGSELVVLVVCFG